MDLVDRYLVFPFLDLWDFQVCCQPVQEAFRQS
jgi:hypothetical protein